MKGLRHWKISWSKAKVCDSHVFWGEMVRLKDWKTFIIYTLSWIFVPYNHSDIRAKLWDILWDKEIWNFIPRKG